ncbi:hypothetical protein CSIM01_02862 [Colletotrichum simmondsii]|uniref:Uncharacterized protein n=1 Tax=Colletotrichum simmondsii TaxID=703756 RepID=A0A135RS85_9PEZI|nr:hypothetical protein CSIM01_02862 [Colletotrichum simmondsii]
MVESALRNILFKSDKTTSSSFQPFLVSAPLECSQTFSNGKANGVRCAATCTFSVKVFQGEHKALKGSFLRYCPGQIEVESSNRDMKPEITGRIIQAHLADIHRDRPTADRLISLL